LFALVAKAEEQGYVSFDLVSFILGEYLPTIDSVTYAASLFGLNVQVQDDFGRHYTFDEALPVDAVLRYDGVEHLEVSWEKVAKDPSEEGRDYALLVARVGKVRQPQRRVAAAPRKSKVPTRRPARSTRPAPAPRTQQTLVSTSRRQSAPVARGRSTQQSTNTLSLRMQGNERIATTFLTTGAGGGNTDSGASVSPSSGFVASPQYTVWPTNAILFPFLSKVARNYRRYKINSLSFEYVPVCSTAQFGLAMMSFNYVAGSATPANANEVSQESLSTETTPWMGSVLRVPPKQSQRLLANRLGNNEFKTDAATTVTQYNTSAGIDYDYGTFQFFTEGNSTAAAAPIGYIKVKYDIWLMEHEPRLAQAPNALALLAPSDLRALLALKALWDQAGRQDPPAQLETKDHLVTTAPPESPGCLDSQDYLVLPDPRDQLEQKVQTVTPALLGRLAHLLLMSQPQ
jgi:hypothetical protein